MSRPSRPLALVVLAGTCLLLVACSPCALLESGRAKGGSDTTPERVRVSPDLAVSLEDTIDRVMGLPSDTPFVLQLTQEELTSYVALRLSGLPLHDPQVWISPGQMRATGVITEPIRTRFSISCSVTGTPSDPELRFETAALDGMPVPKFVLEMLTDRANQIVAQASFDVTVREIILLEGELIISGTR